MISLLYLHLYFRPIYVPMVGIFVIFSQESTFLYLISRISLVYDIRMRHTSCL